MSDWNRMPPKAICENCQHAGELYKLFCKIWIAGLICAFCECAWIVSGDVLSGIDCKGSWIDCKNREHDSDYSRVDYNNRNYSLKHWHEDLLKILETQVYKKIDSECKRVDC